MAAEDVQDLKGQATLKPRKLLKLLVQLLMDGDINHALELADEITTLFGEELGIDA